MNEPHRMPAQPATGRISRLTFDDPPRTDVAYGHFEGHQLDRQLLELLQKY